MGDKPRKLLLTLIVIGLLTGAPACQEATSGMERGTERETDTAVEDHETDSGGMDAGDDRDTYADGVECASEFEKLTVTNSESAAGQTDASALCEDTAPATAAWTAVQVALTADESEPTRATGSVVFAPELAERLNGEPSISVSYAYPSVFADATISRATQTDEGWEFEIAFPEGSVPADPWSTGSGPAQVQIAVQFELRCDDLSGPEVQPVTSETMLYLCGDADTVYWVSPGEECTYCGAMLTEMIAAPLPSISGSSDDALPGALRAEIVPLTQRGNTVLLSVRTNGASGDVTPVWRPSAGRMLAQSGTVALWEMPEERARRLMQVAVRDDRDATVAQYRWASRG